MWAVIVPEFFLPQAKEEAAFKNLTFTEWGNFLFIEGDPVPFAWSNCIWKDVQTISISSIADGAKKLKPLARKWFIAGEENQGRARLILEHLRSAKEGPLTFPAAKEEGVGVFTLREKDLIFYSKDFDRPIPSGECAFVENKSAPSRAYLKAWESISLTGKVPGSQDRCMDLGASPGGWTWALVQLGAKVVSVDRSPLEESLMNSPLVEFRQGDAFSQLPDKVGEMDWIFSDVICYPDKLLEFLRAWIASGKAKNIIFTIKLQGKADPALIAQFESLGRVVHLFYNKHELTFIWDHSCRKN